MGQFAVNHLITSCFSLKPQRLHSSGVMGLFYLVTSSFISKNLFKNVSELFQVAIFSPNVYP
ncbi:hypothetical protein P5673_013298 [Acropora cervicornis]|uniref:Uncharacterized protein n=1 Tax=Acropora cervicornis TaxID=6130 RepID=A0AAD9V7G7_ACRCE|nr:hypothetical protein P5673_013298 [Acropora cervicornis]